MEYIQDMVTADLAKFGGRELSIARKLLDAYCDGKVSGHAADKIQYADNMHIEFNMHSGCVFMADSDMNTYVLCPNDNKMLESFVVCGDCDNEGAESDFEPNTNCAACKELAKELDY